MEEADEWRSEAWKMIRERSDLHFVIITKRIHRFQIGLQEDWGEEYDHVPFWFKQTGTNFKKGNRIYHIERKDQMSQAEKEIWSKCFDSDFLASLGSWPENKNVVKSMNKIQTSFYCQV